MLLSSFPSSLLVLLFTCFAISFQPTAAMNVSNVLIYSYTAGYRHESIPTAVQALEERGPDYGINFVNSEEPSDFNDEFLEQFDALFFLSTTEEGKTHFISHLDSALLSYTLLTIIYIVLTTRGKAAFQRYLDKGGNFIGGTIVPLPIRDVPSHVTLLPKLAPRI
jgi:hypothetical protein